MAKLRGSELMAIAIVYCYNNKNERICMGLFLDLDGALRWMNSGRLFDLLDIYDHCPCKPYVHFTMALPSRTISDSPQIMTQYTFPRACPKTWDKNLQANFQKICDAFAALNPESRELPWQLVPWDSSFVSDEEMEMLKLKCASNETGGEDADSDEALIVDADNDTMMIE